MPSSISPLLVLAALAAAPASAAVVEETVATVNGKPILLSDYRKEVALRIENWKRLQPTALQDPAFAADLRKKTLDQMVDHELLHQDSEKRKFKIFEREIDRAIDTVKERSFGRDELGRQLTETEQEDALARQLKSEGMSSTQYRDRIRRQLMVQKLIEGVVRPAAKPPEEAELKAAFDRVKALVKGSTAAVAGLPEELAQSYLGFSMQVREELAEKARVAHIIVKVSSEAPAAQQAVEQKKAELLKRRIDEGEDFSEIARKHSDDLDSAVRGGDMGYVLKGMTPPEFEKAAFALEVGKVSAPVRTPLGWHLIRVLEKRASQGLSYDPLKPDLAQFLTEVRMREEMEKLVKSLRARATVEIKLPKESSN